MREDDAYYGMINLKALPDSMLVEFEGDDGIFIPFRSNPSLYISDRGIHLDIRVVPMKEGTDFKGNTHCVFATAKHELIDSMSPEDQAVFFPFLGKMYPAKSSKKLPSEGVKSRKPVVKRISNFVVDDDDDKYSGIPFK